MKRRTAKSLISLLLIFCMMVGIVPAEALNVLGALAAAAGQETGRAQQRAQAAAVRETAFAEIAALAQERRGSETQGSGGEWQYVVLPEYNYAVIVGHTDQGTAQVSIPALLGGADVVALLSDVFAGHDALMSVTMTGNVYYAAPDALPRGVTVRGLNGSYAESWAARNRHAFENTSQLDFVAGVVDCSDIQGQNFTRHSETRVTLRELEAGRLQEGSVFFLADPMNAYAISFYKVESVGEASGGFVTFACKTPDIAQVLNSFKFENAPMMADWSTMELADGIQIDEEAARRRASGDATTEYGLMFTTPGIPLKGGAELTFSAGYKGVYTVSSAYAKMKMDYCTVKQEDIYEVSAKVQIEGAMLDDNLPDDSSNVDELTREWIECVENEIYIGKNMDTEQKLCDVTLISIWGIVSFRLSLSFNVEFSGSIEVKYTISTTTTHYIKGDTVTSTCEESKREHSLSVKAEIKIGITAGLKVYLFVAKIASVELFLGLKIEAERTFVYSDEVKEALEGGIIYALDHRRITLAHLNMLDCIEIRTRAVFEAEASLLEDRVKVFHFEMTLFEFPMLHFHIMPKRYHYNNRMLTLLPKTKEEILHTAAECPLKDSVALFVPEIDKTNPLGEIILYGSEQAIDKPELDLPNYGVRVKDWYEDKKLTKKITDWPKEVKSGDILYGDIEQVGVTTLVNYAGETITDKNGKEVVICLGEGETISTADLNLKNADHIAGWAYVKSADDLTFLDEAVMSPDIELTGDGERHVLLAIFDNDLTITFRDTENQVCGMLVTGHFMEITEDQVPVIQPFDPSEAIAVYEWRDIFGNAYTFPCVVKESLFGDLTLNAWITSIDRVYEVDDTPSNLEGSNSAGSGLATYSSATDFYYYNRGDSIVINGFISQRNGTDEYGNELNWTVEPEKLVIPAYIDGLPVTSIQWDAFKNMDKLVAVTLPSTVTSVGESAFAECPALVSLDLSACSRLTALPASMARDCPMLSQVSLPDHLMYIGNEAFRNCTSLTSMVINAALGNDVFSGCTSLKKVTLLNGVSYIGYRAFQNCSALTSLRVPCSATSVGGNFIYGCTALTELTFDGRPTTLTADIMRIGPNSHLQSLTIGLGVMTIGDNAFSNGSDGNPHLTSISLPEALREVGEGALSGTAVTHLVVHDLGVIGTGFARNCETLREVVFEKGVISAYAFAGCTNLEKVTMGDGVYSIGASAFEKCTSLKEITVGDGLEYVGDRAFQDCSALTEARLGEKLETLGKNAFRNCTALTTVELGDSLLTVGEGAFSGCKALTAVHFPNTVLSFGSNFLYDCVSLQALTIGGPGTPVITDEWLGYIENSVLETLVIGEGVTELSNRAFSNVAGNNVNYGHRKLTSVTLPSTLEVIGWSAFRNNSALPTLTLPASLKTIGGYAFDGCTALDVVCAEGMQLEEIGDHAFLNCTSLTSINLGDALTTVGDAAFSGCTALAEIHFPPSVASFGENVLYQCTGLKSLTIGGPNTPVLTEEIMGHIEDSSLETLVIGEGVTELSNRAFSNVAGNNVNYGHRKLTSLTLPSTLETIGWSAFRNNSTLETLNLPASLKTIEGYAFDGCTALDIVYAEGMQLTEIGDHAFLNCTSLTSIRLGDALTTVGDAAFSGCTALAEVHFPPSVTSYGESILYQCSGLKSLTIGGPGAPVLPEELMGYIEDSTLETLVIGEGVTELGRRSFSNVAGNNVNYGHRKLTSLTLPSTLEIIGGSALRSNSALPTLTLPASLKTIEGYAFDGCTALTLVCPENMQLTALGDHAFLNCTSLTSINLGNALTTVGDAAFSGCTALTEVHFPPSVTSYGESILYQCSGLKSLTIGGPNTPVLTEELMGYIEDSSLETLVIGEGVTELGRRSFSNVSGNNINHGHRMLKHVVLPSTLEIIGWSALRSNSALETLMLPSGIQVIDELAFEGCSALRHLSSKIYSAVIDAYAQSTGITYLYGEEMPSGYALTFMDGDLLLGSERVAAGADITGLLQQYAPSRAGEMLDAWYTDAACTAGWPLGTMPSFDLTLYAGMIPTHTVTFLGLSGGSVVYERAFTVGEGRLIPWPEEPEVSGCRFEGWYLDAAMTQAFLADCRMGNSDLTVYGKFSALQAGAVYTEVEGGLELSRYILLEGQDTEVWLPGMVDGKPVVSIAADAFRDAQGVTRLHLPDTLTNVTPETFGALETLEWIYTGPGSAAYTAVNGMLFTSDLSTLVCFPRCKPAVALNLPESVTAIAAHACENAVWLQRVSLSDSVTTLGAYAFAGCPLTSFTAYGLTEIGEEALPTDSGGLIVYGPIQTGALRDFLLITNDQGASVFAVAYNLYHVALHVDGELVTTLGLEAGSTLPYDFVYGEMADGYLIHTWFTDSALTVAWHREDATPAQDISLYTASAPVYSHETATLTDGDGNEISGVRLTAYNGLGGALVLPRSIDGLPVLAIGERFLAGCHGAVSSVQIGSEVIEIADTAFDAPQEYPFGGVIRADEGSYAAQWAAQMGYSTGLGTYTLAFECNGGSLIAAKTVVQGAYVKLPVPVKTGCTFAGWYLDAALSEPAPLEEDCFLMPGADTTLYAAWAGDAQEWTFTYAENDGEITITGYTGSETSLTIPASINGMSVTAIADHAFAGNQTLTSICLPDTLRTIGSGAFRNTALVSADLGGAKTVGQNAFAGCTALTDIAMKGATTLLSGAFADCTALQQIEIPARMADVSTDAFRGCTSLSAFTVEEGNVLYRAEEGVLILSGTTLFLYPEARTAEHYALPGGVTMIGANAFRNAAYLRSLSLPDDLAHIGEGAFSGCTGLTSFELRESMTFPRIPANAFLGCTSLEQVTLNGSIAEIGAGAFFGCTALERITLPQMVTAIEPMAFDSTVTLCGAYGSEAWRYATENGLLFVDPNAIEVTALTIENEPALLLGDVVTLTAALTPANALLNGEMEWRSSDSSELYLYGNTAHAVGTGSATITAIAPNGVTASLNMTVTAAVRMITLSATELTLTMGDSALLSAAITPQNAADQHIAWSSDRPEIAQVDAQGRVTALSAGSAVITAASANGVTASCRVTVRRPAAPSAQPLTLVPGQQVLFPLTDGTRVAWSVTDAAIATAEGSLITALTEGTTLLICTTPGGSTFEIQLVVCEMNTLTLPAMLLSIEAEAFAGLTGAERVVAGDRLTAIGSGAFAQSPSLQQLVLPASVTSIAEDAFDESLLILCEEGSYAAAYAEAHALPYALTVAD